VTHIAYMAGTVCLFRFGAGGRCHGAALWASVCVLVLACVLALRWHGPSHDVFSRWGARLAPPPFPERWRDCRWAHLADAYADMYLGHCFERWSRWHWTLAAIDALRAGQVRKALFMASYSTHYLTDYTTFAHAWSWALPENRLRYLPAFARGLASRIDKDKYIGRIAWDDVGAQLIEGGRVLPVRRVDHEAGLFAELDGNLHKFHDRMPVPEEWLDPEILAFPDGWTFFDFDTYAQWLNNVLALRLVDVDSAGGKLALKNAREVRPIYLAQMVNAVQQCAIYYSYISTAASAEVIGSIGDIPGPMDKFRVLAREGARVVVPRGASWPLRRAALVLALSFRRAEARRAADSSRETPPLESYILDDGAAEEDLGKYHLVILGSPRENAVARRLGEALPARGSSGAIVIGKGAFGPDRWTALVAGASVQHTLHLVDYLLDLACAPVHGRWPPEAVVGPQREMSTSLKVLANLKKMEDSDRLADAYRPEYHNADDGKWKEFLPRVNETLEGGWNLEEWFDELLFTRLLPDGGDARQIMEDKAFLETLGAYLDGKSAGGKLGR